MRATGSSGASMQPIWQSPYSEYSHSDDATRVIAPVTQPNTGRIPTVSTLKCTCLRQKPRGAVYVQEISISRRSACGAALRNSLRPSSLEVSNHPPPKVSRMNFTRQENADTPARTSRTAINPVNKIRRDAERNSKNPRIGPARAKYLGL